jgi:hypothetical protein
MKTRIVLAGLLATASVALAQLEVTSGGNVGVGTSAPSGQLEVFRAAGPGAMLRLNTGFSGGNAVDLNPFITGINNGGFEIALAGTPRLVISPSGNVGIGTTSPGTNLDVVGGVTVRTSNPALGRLYFNPGGSGYAGYIDWYRNAGARLGYMGYQDLAGSQSNLGLNLENGANFIIGGGNVGIGSATPSQKLEVAGSVKATSFISSTTTYADFVFEPGYKLPALSEVEAHIKAHGHLPGVPSEAQVAKEGIDLAAMQVKLLQKIEELTLHQIAQEKQLRAQNAVIQTLLAKAAAN